jgi:hypothetical protein
MIGEQMPGKRILLVGALWLVLVASGCGSPAGKTDDAEIVRGDSTRFSSGEIAAAEQAVLTKFRDFEGCELLELRYDEAFSDAGVESYLTYGAGADSDLTNADVIVLASDFHTPENGPEQGFNSDSDYTDWQWILTRTDASAPWEVAGWGY